MKHLSFSLILISTLLIVSCKQEKKKEVEIEEPKKEAPAIKSLTKVWESDTVLTTCESVFYDASADVLYVANIGGVPPDAKDGDGFISKVSTNGEVLELNWVQELHAPKGMGKVGNSLYVTNIDEVVEIDIEAGSISNRFAIEGSKFLNDITTSEDGTIFISDNRNNKIHSLKDGTTSTWLEKEDFGGPNGLLHQGSKMVAATFGSGSFMSIDTQTKEITELSSGLKGGDGIVAVGDDYLVSTWHGEVYFIKSDGNKTKLLDTKDAKLNAADLGYLPAKNLVFVPTFFGNTVAAYELK